jgi:hypothetical protein
MNILTMNKCAMALVCLPLIMIVALHASERSFGSPEMKLVKETEIAGRKVLRYEHNSVPEWGYAKLQSDYFYVLPPKGNPGGRPLHVVLHSAGHSGDLALTEASKHPDWFHYSGLDDQIVVYLDCRANQGDWWWGAHAMGDGKGKYKTAYTPAEKRVLTTIEWVITKYKVDRNRVYLSGISMGGSGSLGIGMCRGDIFAAINVGVPAGVDHIQARTFGQQIPDPPILINFSSTNDKWVVGQEKLVAECQKMRYALIFSWGPNGHTSSVASFHPAAVAFPWRTIRKDEAYPVFSNTSTDNMYPGFEEKLGGDDTGQIGALFRWNVKTDEPTRFQIELRMVTQAELKTEIKLPTTAIADVTMRRLQQFKPESAECSWQLKRGGTILKSGHVTPDIHGLLSLEKLEIVTEPAILTLTR